MNIGALLKDLQSLKTKEEATRYLLKTLKENGPEGWTSIKYVVGYLGNEERDRILKLFSHEN